MNLAIDNRTPALVLSCNLGALSVARSLGALGVPVYGIDSNPQSPALRSRFFQRTYIRDFDQDRPEEYLQSVLKLGKLIGERIVLIPTSDEIAEWVADYREELRSRFIFQDNPPELVRGLASKKEMFNIARRNGIPTPKTLFPESAQDLEKFIDSLSFPVMLKGIYGNRLQARTGYKMVTAQNRNELIYYYRLLEEPKYPNLMIQELIPGADDQVYIFNGYFDTSSQCLAEFTGYKVRQFPIHTGCASLGECRWNQKVADLTKLFMSNIGYQGILDIGYRLDPRDGQFKVLDVNPRLGQAFRIFVGKMGLDVVRALYLDLTNQMVPSDLPREGRRWIIEDFDLLGSLFPYLKEGSLTISQWIRSFRGVEEGAWFSRTDPKPFLKMVGNHARRLQQGTVRKTVEAMKFAIR